MRTYHGWTNSEIEDYIRLLLANSALYAGKQVVAGTRVRDLTDRKFLALAVESASSFVVTNDRRHLLPLRKFGTTRIVSPTGFLGHLT
jgi:predicted nucleic acid-binding protein